MKKYIVILILLCMAVYANSLKGVYLSDDLDAVKRNPDILSLSHNWQYPMYYTDTFLYSLNHIHPKDSAYNHHIDAILWHSANTIIVFLFLMLFFSQRGSFWGAIIFAVHPIHTETVNWVVGGRYLTLFFFTMLPFLLYHYATIKKLKLKLYLIALSMFTYNFTSPLTFYVLLPLYLLLDDWYFKKFNKKYWLPFIGILIFGIIFKHSTMVDRASEIQHYGTNQSLFYFITDTFLETKWSDIWLFTPTSFFSGLRLIFLPYNFTLYYEPIYINMDFLINNISPLFITLCLLMLVFKSAKKLYFILIFYFITLLPTYSPVPIVHLIAERYLYISSIIVCFFIALWTDKFKGKLYTTLFICLVVIYSGLTIWRNTDYCNSKVFWQKTAEISPMNPLAYNNLGTALAEEGKYNEAIKQYCKAFRLNPDDKMVIENIRLTFYKQGFKFKYITYNYAKNSFKINIEKIK